MNKKVLRAGAVSAVAAGIGAAAVMAGKRRSKKEEENSDYRNTELGKFAKNSKGIYYTNGNYGAFGVRVPVSYLMSLRPDTSLFKIGLATPMSSVVQLLLCLGFMVILNRRARKGEIR